jgi:hypothetical protein
MWIQIQIRTQGIFSEIMLMTYIIDSFADMYTLHFNILKLYQSANFMTFFILYVYCAFNPLHDPWLPIELVAEQHRFWIALEILFMALRSRSKQKFVKQQDTFCSILKQCQIIPQKVHLSHNGQMETCGKKAKPAQKFQHYCQDCGFTASRPRYIFTIFFLQW